MTFSSNTTTIALWSSAQNKEQLARLHQAVESVAPFPVMSLSEWDDRCEDMLFWNRISLLILHVDKAALMRDTVKRYATAARRCHVPLCFVRTEELDFRVFEDIFGNVHCFDASETVDRDTLLAQLRNKLYMLLAPAEDLATIRSHFSDGLFLSYRKIDRPYLDRLYDLIRRDPRFRDTAIWFDNYLIPAENYDDSIDNAIIAAKVFLLVVTPHLLEEPNYVCSREYPLAVKQGKPILPLCCIPTPTQALQRLYAGLPPCLDADSVGVTDRLAEMLSLCALDETPEHLYYIALAYLLGVDTRKDAALAKTLFLKAAQGGYTEGFFRLGMMYANGNGVERSPLEAIRWLEQYLVSSEPETVTDTTPSVLDTILGGNRRFLQKEYDALQTQLNRRTALIELIRLYDEQGCSVEPYQTPLCAVFKNLLHHLYVFHPLITKFDMIVGYEKECRNGVYAVGKSIHQDVYAVTGLLTQTDFIDALEQFEKMLFRVNAHIFLQFLVDVFPRIENAVELLRNERQNGNKVHAASLVKLLLRMCTALAAGFNHPHYTALAQTLQEELHAGVW